MGEAACLQIRIRCMLFIYYHREYGQFIDLSGSEWLAPLAVAATTVVVTALSVVLLTVSTLAVSPQVTTTLNGVVVPDVALGAVALLPLEPSVRALAAANHGNSFWSRARWLSREVECLNLNDLEWDAGFCNYKSWYIYINTRRRCQGLLAESCYNYLLAIILRMKGFCHG